MCIWIREEMEQLLKIFKSIDDLQIRLLNSLNSPTRNKIIKHRRKPHKAFNLEKFFIWGISEK